MAAEKRDPMHTLKFDTREWARANAAKPFYLLPVLNQANLFEACVHLQIEPSNLVKTELLRTLGEFGDDYAVRFILPLRGHRNRFVRGRAVEALVALNAPTAFENAMALANDGKSIVARQHGIRALGNYVEKHGLAKPRHKENARKAVNEIAKAFLGVKITPFAVRESREMLYIAGGAFGNILRKHPDAIKLVDARLRKEVADRYDSTFMDSVAVRLRERNPGAAYAIERMKR